MQPTIKRLVASLKKRGYVVWFGENADAPFALSIASLFSFGCVLCVCADLERMKGSVVDA